MVRAFLAGAAILLAIAILPYLLLERWEAEYSVAAVLLGWMISFPFLARDRSPRSSKRRR